MEGKKLFFGKRDRLPFFSALLCGLSAHGFMLLNKIPVDDDICNFFNKGATTVSGRWGLEALRLIMPDQSMPWIYGLISLLFLAAAVCLTVRLFEIKSPILQVLLAAVFVSFPAETGTMSYMFTAAPYALALLLGIAAVYIYARGGRLRRLISPVLLIFSCSIYQGYFAFAASFCVLLMIKRLLDNEKTTREILTGGFRMLLMLLLSVGVYGLTVLLAGKATGTLTADVINREQSLLMRIAVAYSAFLHTLLRGYFAYVSTGLSRVMHIVLLLAAAVGILQSVREHRDIKRTALLCLCLFLLPLSCYCLYMLADNGYIHSLALYPFASVYVLAALVLDRPLPGKLIECRTAAAAALAVITVINIYFANSFYLYSHLQYENTKAFYTSLLTQVMRTEGFDENTKLALIGERSEAVYDIGAHFDFAQFQLPGNNITKTTHAEDIVNHYLGWDIPFADEQECLALAETDEFAGMPVYPYCGSVQKIGDHMVVRLS